MWNANPRCAFILCARWRFTTWTNHSHCLAHPHRHKLMRHIPGMGILASLPDYLHTKHLGVDAQFVGAVLLALITLIMPGEVDANLDILWDEIKKLYKTSHTANRLGVLTRNMIKKGKAAFPCLSARGCQIRDFLPIMIKTLKKHMDVGNAAHRDMLFWIDGFVGNRRDFD